MWSWPRPWIPATATLTASLAPKAVDGIRYGTSGAQGSSVLEECPASKTTHRVLLNFGHDSVRRRSISASERPFVSPLFLSCTRFDRPLRFIPNCDTDWNALVGSSPKTHRQEAGQFGPRLHTRDGQG